MRTSCGSQRRFCAVTTKSGEEVNLNKERVKTILGNLNWSYGIETTSGVSFHLLFAFDKHCWKFNVDSLSCCLQKSWWFLWGILFITSSPTSPNQMSGIVWKQSKWSKMRRILLSQLFSRRGLQRAWITTTFSIMMTVKSGHITLAYIIVG